MAKLKYKIDPKQVEKAWKRAGYASLKDVFREDGNENYYMRYDGAQKRINSGEVSFTIMDFLSKRLNCAFEYLSGEYSDDAVKDWGMPDSLYTQYRDFYNMTPEEKNQYYQAFIVDLGIAHKWMKMNNHQRNMCHTAIKEFINWWLDYVKPDEEAYNKLFKFFEETGSGLETNPSYRKKILNSLNHTYEVSIKSK